MNEVERIHEELVALRQIISNAQSPSDLNAFDVLAAKSLLLAAASYFERQICDGIEHAAGQTGATPEFVNFISKQGLKRKFHTLFDWEKTNVNGFLGLFGPEAKKVMDDEIRSDTKLQSAVQDFLFIGSQRNQLIHNNFASYPLSVDTKEIWEKFGRASMFTEWVPKKLVDIGSKEQGDR